jgi:multiple sugar transport system permease protein
MSYKKLKYLIFGFLTASFMITTLFPFYFAFITSFKTDHELYNLQMNPLWISQGWTLKHYQYLFFQTNFKHWLLNSIIVSIIVTIFSTTTSTLAAYALTRLSFKGSSLVAIAIMLCYLVPPTLLFIPLAFVVSLFKLTNTIWSLVLTYPSFTIPLETWLLMNYFSTIPKDIEESAMIDGATRPQVLLKIVLPVAAPGLATAALFGFSQCWAQFIYPAAFITFSPNKVLSVGVPVELVKGDVFYWGPLMAGTVAAALPVVLVYLIFTRYFVAGLTAGAVKM